MGESTGLDEKRRDDTLKEVLAVSARGREFRVVPVQLFGEEEIQREKELVFCYGLRIEPGEKFSMIVIDTEDPLVLYDFLLDQSSYDRLAREHKLTKGFSEFPRLFETLLDSCLTQSAWHMSLHDGRALVVQEQLGWRWATHLTISLEAADDARLKQHLAEETQQFRAKFVEALREAEALRGVLATHDQRLQEERDAMRREVEAAHAAHVRAEGQLRAAGACAIEARSREAEEALASLLDERRRESESFRAELREAGERVEKAEAERRELHIQFEGKSERVCCLEREVASVREQMGKMEVECERLQAGKSDLVRALEKETANAARLNARCVELDAALHDHVRLVDASSSSVDDMRAQLRAKVEHIAELETKLSQSAHKDQEMTWMIEKSRQVIKTYQNERREARQLLDERDREIERLRQRVSQLEAAHGRHDGVERDLTTRLWDAEAQASELAKDLEACRGELATSECTRKYLESELNRVKVKDAFAPGRLATADSRVADLAQLTPPPSVGGASGLFGGAPFV